MNLQNQKKMIKKPFNMKYSRFLLLIISLVISGNVLAQEYSDSRKIVKSYPAGTSTNVDISNKYGKVLIIHSDNDSVRIVIDLTIKSQNESKLEKLKSSIDFDFSTTSQYIIARTIVGGKQSKWASQLQSLTDVFDNQGNKVEINYTIHAPDYVNIKIENKYGDVYVDDLKGDFVLALSNGDFKAGSISGNADIEIKFGDGDIKYLNKGKVSVLYSDFYLSKANRINFDSRSSKIRIDDINVLKINSRRDKYYITENNKLYGETYFSDLILTHFYKETNISMKYGNLTMENIDRMFTFIELNSKYTDIKLYFIKGSGYRFNMVHNDIDFTYPETLGKLEEKPVDADSKDILTQGSVGNSQSMSKVKITANSGKISIVHKQ